MTVVTEPPTTKHGVRVTAVIAALLCVALASCSPSATTVKTASGATVLHWYIGPDRVDASAIAKACSQASDGKYVLKVESLPADADERHNLLVRRLAAKDPSIDLIGLDDSFTAEFADAQYLAPVPDDLAATYVKGAFPAAVKAASYDGALVAAPWWLDPQVLWYRGTVAERAGLDMTKPVAWDKLLEGASRVGVSVEIDDANGRGAADWVNALVADAGGTVVDGKGRKATVGLSGEAGAAAASIVQFYQESKSGQGPSDQALRQFAGTSGGFLIAPTSALADPAVAAVAADMKAAAYPVIDTATTGVAPLAGINLAVPLYAPHSELSFDAINCLTSDTTLAALMTSAGHSSSKSTTYDVPGVSTSFPMATVAKAAVLSGAAVPQTPYWQLIRSGIQKSWLPLSSVSTSSTPRESQKTVKALLAGELP